MCDCDQTSVSIFNGLWEFSSLDLKPIKNSSYTAEKRCFKMAKSEKLTISIEVFVKIKL